MIVFAGGNEKSSAAAAKALRELAEWKINATQVSRLTHQAGQEIGNQQAQRTEQFHQREARRPLTEPRQVSQQAPANLPEVGVVEMDGGRIRTRQEGQGRGVTKPHWRESNIGCVVRLQSKASEEDPRPDLPRLFLARPKVHKLVSQLHRQRSGTGHEGESIAELLASEALVENRTNDAVAEAALRAPCPNGPSEAESASQRPADRRPKRLARTCVATLEGADACGRMLAAEAASRGLDQAKRKGFLGDGQTSLWSVWQRYFREYIPILDFIHLLSYVYSAAMSVGDSADAGWSCYVKWIKLLWGGKAAEVLSEWRTLGERLELPLDEALPEHDPRRPLQRAITYLQNNLDRVDYPRYRRLGLPVTSTLVESLVKEFNMRVKGTEKFWNDPSGAESILAVRAMLLSDDDRFGDYFATRPGCCYHRRSTQAAEQTSLATAT